jgi:hypothetical protein
MALPDLADAAGCRERLGRGRCRVLGQALTEPSGLDRHYRLGVHRRDGFGQRQGASPGSSRA